MKIEVICGNCGDPVRVSFYEVKGGKLIMTLDEDHECRRLNKSPPMQEWWAFPADEWGEPLEDAEVTKICIEGGNVGVGDTIKDASALYWHLYKKCK